MSDMEHKCSDSECVYLGQRTTAGMCRCHKSNEQMLRDRVDALVEALEDLIIAATCEVNEKGAGGFMLARLSDAKKVLGTVAPDRLTALVGGSGKP